MGKYKANDNLSDIYGALLFLKQQNTYKDEKKNTLESFKKKKKMEKNGNTLKSTVLKIINEQKIDKKDDFKEQIKKYTDDDEAKAAIKSAQYLLENIFNIKESKIKETLFDDIVNEDESTINEGSLKTLEDHIEQSYKFFQHIHTEDFRNSPFKESLNNINELRLLNEYFIELEKNISEKTNKNEILDFILKNKKSILKKAKLETDSLKGYFSKLLESTQYSQNNLFGEKPETNEINNFSLNLIASLRQAKEGKIDQMINFGTTHKRKPFNAFETILALNDFQFHGDNKELFDYNKDHFRKYKPKNVKIDIKKTLAKIRSDGEEEDKDNINDEDDGARIKKMLDNRLDALIRMGIVIHEDDVNNPKYCTSADSMKMAADLYQNLYKNNSQELFYNFNKTGSGKTKMLEYFKLLNEKNKGNIKIEFINHKTSKKDIYRIMNSALSNNYEKNIVIFLDEADKVISQADKDTLSLINEVREICNNKDNKDSNIKMIEMTASPDFNQLESFKESIIDKKSSEHKCPSEEREKYNNYQTLLDNSYTTFKISLLDKESEIYNIRKDIESEIYNIRKEIESDFNENKIDETLHDLLIKYISYIDKKKNLLIDYKLSSFNEPESDIQAEDETLYSKIFEQIKNINNSSESFPEACMIVTDLYKDGDKLNEKEIKKYIKNTNINNETLVIMPENEGNVYIITFDNQRNSANIDKKELREYDPLENHKIVILTNDIRLNPSIIHEKAFPVDECTQKLNFYKRLNNVQHVYSDKFEHSAFQLQGRNRLKSDAKIHFFDITKNEYFTKNQQYIEQSGLETELDRFQETTLVNQDQDDDKFARREGKSSIDKDNNHSDFNIKELFENINNLSNYTDSIDFVHKKQKYSNSFSFNLILFIKLLANDNGIDKDIQSILKNSLSSIKERLSAIAEESKSEISDAKSKKINKIITMIEDKEYINNFNNYKITDKMKTNITKMCENEVSFGDKVASMIRNSSLFQKNIKQKNIKRDLKQYKSLMKLIQSKDSQTAVNIYENHINNSK